MSDALDLVAALVLENGHRWGESAVPEQWDDARAILDKESVTPLHYLTRSRGYSKTADLAAVAIGVLLTQAPERSRSYALAADVSQGQLLLDALSGFVARTPELHGALTLQETRVIEPRGGATLSVLPADQSSVWGLRPYFSVIDEIAQWAETARARRCFEAVTTGAAKLAGSRVVILTSAGSPGHWSKGVLDAAYEDELWRVNELDGPAPWLDQRRLDGEKRRLPESSFARLFLNRWTANEDALANEEDLAACVTLDGPLEPTTGIRYVVAVDIGLKHDRTVAAVCHSERQEGSQQPTVVLDRMETWQGSRLRSLQLSVVEEWVEQASRRYNRARIRFDPWQAAGMVQRLKGRGIPVEEFSFTAASVGKLASTLLTLIREHALALPDDPELLDELRNVRLRESAPGVYRLDHDRGRHDDRAVALALAATWLTERNAAVRPIRVSKLHRRERHRPPVSDLAFRTARDPALSAVGANQQYTPASIDAAEARILGPSWGRPRRSHR